MKTLKLKCYKNVKDVWENINKLFLKKSISVCFRGLVLRGLTWLLWQPFSFILKQWADNISGGRISQLDKMCLTFPLKIMDTFGSTLIDLGTLGIFIIIISIFIKKGRDTIKKIQKQV